MPGTRLPDEAGVDVPAGGLAWGSPTMRSMALSSVRTATRAELNTVQGLRGRADDRSAWISSRFLGSATMTSPGVGVLRR